VIEYSALFAHLRDSGNTAHRLSVFTCKRCIFVNIRYTLMAGVSLVHMGPNKRTVKVMQKKRSDTRLLAPDWSSGICQNKLPSNRPMIIDYPWIDMLLFHHTAASSAEREARRTRTPRIRSAAGLRNMFFTARYVH